MKELYLPDWKIQEWKKLGVGSDEEKFYRLELISDWFAGQTEDESNWRDLRDLRHVFNAFRCVARDNCTTGGWKWEAVMVLWKRLHKIIRDEWGAEVLHTVDAI